MLHKLRREKTLDFPIYIGGLCSKISEIYDRRAQLGRRQLPRLQLLDELRPFVLNAETIHDAQTRPGRVYALSSGMMTPKTLSNIFAQRVVDQARHSIFFVGYADPESPAGILRNARPDEQVTLDADGSLQRVRCHIEQFQFSAHASRESLIAFAERLSPKKVLLVHGDPLAVEWMRARLATDLPNSEIVVPTPGMELEL
jgi:Cft2 family RNA processing exonuclease